MESLLALLSPWPTEEKAWGRSCDLVEGLREAKVQLELLPWGEGREQQAKHAVRRACSGRAQQHMVLARRHPSSPRERSTTATDSNR